jgi:hypothetical protein
MTVGFSECHSYNLSMCAVNRDIFLALSKPFFLMNRPVDHSLIQNSTSTWVSWANSELEKEILTTVKTKAIEASRNGENKVSIWMPRLKFPFSKTILRRAVSMSLMLDNISIIAKNISILLKLCFYPSIFAFLASFLHWAFSICRRYFWLPLVSLMLDNISSLLNLDF